MNTGSTLYRKAFEDYLRKGIPIEFSLKQANPTTHYIWRTRKDGKVRSSHAANDGKIFAWNNPPATGHPGEEYGCRCHAVAYAPGISEFMDISLSDVNDTGAEWSSRDFVNHYWNGKGKGVTLREVGHLIKIVDAYMKIVGKNLKGQIADRARNNVGGAFVYTFENSYQMQNLVFSVGDTTIGGIFLGDSTLKHGALEVTGSFGFYQTDKFTDPTDFGIDFPLSQDYDISDVWGGSLYGLVLNDRAKSRFREK